MAVLPTVSPQVLPEPLLSEKLRLLSEGFADWSKAQYMIFVRASAKNGRGAYDRIAAEVGKAEKDVRVFQSFWKHVWVGWCRRVSSCFSGVFGLDVMSCIGSIRGLVHGPNTLSLSRPALKDGRGAHGRIAAEVGKADMCMGFRVVFEACL